MSTPILPDATPDSSEEQNGPQQPSPGAPKPEGGRLFRQISSLLVTRAAVIGLTFLTGLIVARSVGPAGKGALTVLTSLVTLASVFAGFGFAAGGVHLYKGKKFDVGTIAGVAGVFWTVAMVIAALLLYAGGDSIVRLFSNEGSAVFRQEWLWLSLSTLPAMLVSTLVHAVLLVDNKMRIYAWLTISSQVAGLVLAWVLVAGYGWGVTGALLANAAAQGLTLLFSIGWLGSRGVEGRLRAPSWAVGPVLRASGGPYVNGILANVFKHGEGILLVLLLDLRSVGQYGVALAFYQLLTEAPRAMVWPLVGRMTAAGGEATDITARSIRVVPIGLAVPVLLMAAGSPLIIPFVYGADFAPAGSLLAWMSLGVLFRAVALVIYSYMVVAGRLEKIAGCMAVAAIVNLLLDIILVPMWGLVGVAVSNVIAEFLLAFLSIVVFLRETREPLASVLTRRSDFVFLWRHVNPWVMSWR